MNETPLPRISSHTRRQVERHRFYFIYRNQQPFQNSCNENEIEDSIRYWLGKSPGIYKDDIEAIISMPESAVTDRMYIFAKIAKDEADYERRLREQEERATFERLKSKYET